MKLKCNQYYRIIREKQEKQTSKKVVQSEKLKIDKKLITYENLNTTTKKGKKNKICGEKQSLILSYFKKLT